VDKEAAVADANLEFKLQLYRRKVTMKNVVLRLSLVLISLIIIGLMLSSRSDAGIDKKTIVGLWYFDEGSGDTATDASGNGNHGKLIDGPKWVSGQFKKALEFDNKGTYVDCGNDESLDLNSFTLSAWVYPTTIDSGTHEMIMGKGWSATERSYYMSILQGKPFVSYRNPDNTAQADLYGTTDLQKSKWYHIAGTNDRSTKTVSIYLDGVKEEEKEFDHDVMVTPKLFWIGNLGDHQLFFGGKIDEVAIFNVALQDADIQTVMNGGIKAVSSDGHLATVWGDLKTQ
jgi:hypothetical protein